MTDFDVFTDAAGVTIKTHAAGKCKNEHCTIHNPSDHSMRDFPQIWRWDRGIMERRCSHGVGHPDPDEISDDEVHGCDGCCCEDR